MDNQNQLAQGATPTAAQPAVGGVDAKLQAEQQTFGAGEQQAAQAAQKANAPTTTQNTILISEIRDNLVILKDGSFRAVVSCKSINFDLMSTNEREGVEYSFQNFLNSLYFDLQILVRSLRVDIGPYLDKLADLRRSQDNMLLNVLMDDYMNFIDILSQEANIMSKEFYIVIPYFTTETADKVIEQGKGFFKKMFGNSGPSVTKIDKETYDKAVTEMSNRVESVMSGMFQIGVQSARLTTKELGELYYNFNNPDTALREPLGNFSDVAQLYVGREGAPPQPMQPAQPAAQPPVQAPPQQPLPPTGVANG